MTKDNFSLNLQDYPINLDTLSQYDKLGAICKFLKVTASKKNQFFTQSKYEISSLEDSIDRLKKSKTFNQQNFTNLIEKCKLMMSTERQDNIYIEKLKKDLVNVELEKNSVIEKTKGIIDSLKQDNLRLINKIASINKEKEKADSEKFELIKKSEEIHKKALENNQLKAEINTYKTKHKREINRVEVMKDREVKILTQKLEYAIRFEKEVELVTKEKHKLKNHNKELKLEVDRLITENYKLQSEITKSDAQYHKLTVRTKNYERLYKECKDTISL